MIRSFLVFACLCAAPAAAQDVQILPGHSDFRLPAQLVHDQPMSLVQDWIIGFPDGEGRPELQLLSEVDDTGRLVIVLTESGLADDSVSAVRQRFELIRTDAGAWALTAYGFQQQCARGGSEDWLATPCP
ncbi:hypothetical protein [Nioella sediminis]|jgi:hypothetical protein|uniref:hypothetical protein n=1 Tax=Nioella sediminis TaxID=1912092 RepID=UPI0008FD6B5F|nr:hypothetical protein [Nioella sediminis]TBX28238.1 hypothetical protein TK43_06370 [Roseovarius sp. JS7-11]